MNITPRNGIDLDTHWGGVNVARLICVHLRPSAVKIFAIRTKLEIKRLQERERTAQAYSKHRALLRRLELETLRDLGENANARIYIGFDKHVTADVGEPQAG